MKFALASDFDSTLYNRLEPWSIPDSELAAIQRFQARGGLFALNSGRAFQALVKHLSPDLRPDFIITSSGAEIRDASHSLIFHCEHSPEISELVFRRIHDKTFFAVQTSEKIFQFKGREFSQFDFLPDIKDLPFPAIALSAYCENEASARSIAASLLAELSDAIEIHINRDILDIVPRGCSKGAALRFCKKHFDLDLLAGIGDNFNDVPMLEASDLAFTFPEVPELVRSHCPYIVNSVAEALDTILEHCHAL